MAASKRVRRKLLGTEGSPVGVPFLASADLDAARPRCRTLGHLVLKDATKVEASSVDIVTR